MHSTDSAGGACDRLTIGIPSKWPLPPKASFHLLASIHDEQFGAVGRITAVGFATVADLITHSRTKNLHAAVFQLGVQLTLQTQKHVALFAPVIRQVARRVIDNSDANISELPCTPIRYTLFSCMCDRESALSVLRTVA